ncbi:uncharacterized protein LOC135185781 [Pogoniulus pusillus]|uniref:uncharacterized protein LOC135185781 n=1 Tax=Pogoniulus pusillus TaxID=488313 RepID=UPI0030B95233
MRLNPAPSRGAAGRAGSQLGPCPGEGPPSPRAAAAVPAGAAGKQPRTPDFVSLAHSAKLHTLPYPGAAAAPRRSLPFSSPLRAMGGRKRLFASRLLLAVRRLPRNSQRYRAGHHALAPKPPAGRGWGSARTAGSRGARCGVAARNGPWHPVPSFCFPAPRFPRSPPRQPTRELNFLLPARLGRGRGAWPDSTLDTHNSWSCQNFLRSASAPAPAASATAAACSSSAPGGSARGEGAGPVYNEAAAAAAGQRRSQSRRQLPGPLRGGGAQRRDQPPLARSLHLVRHLSQPRQTPLSRGGGVIVCETLPSSALFLFAPPFPSSCSPHAAPPATCAGRRRLRPAMRGGGGGGGGEEERSRGSRRSIGIPITIFILIIIIHVSLSSC